MKQGKEMANLITQVAQGQHINVPVTSEAEHQEHSKPSKRKILRPQSPRSQGKKTLVLDLDETLVHSSFKPPNDPSLILNVEIEGRTL